MMEMQKRNGAIYEVQSAVQKDGEKCVHACGWTLLWGWWWYKLQTVQEVGKCKVCLGNRMESDHLQEKTIGGGRNET